MKRIIVGLMLIVVFGLLSVQCQKEGTENFTPGVMEELNRLPDAPLGVGYMNVQALRESPFFSMMKENWERTPFQSREYQEFMDATGLDLRKDIDEIFIGVVPAQDQEEYEMSGVVLIKGNFDPAKIMEFIRQEKDFQEMAEESYRDITLYLPAGKKFVFCFADASRLVAGQEALVKSWLDKYRLDSGKVVDTGIADNLQSLRYKNGAWFSLDTRSFIDKMMNEMERRSDDRRFAALKFLEKFNFSMQADQDLWFSGNGRFTDSEKAQLFQDTIKGFIAAAKLSVSEDREAVDVLNKITVKSRANEVVMEFHMTRDDVDRLKNHRHKIATR